MDVITDMKIRSIVLALTLWFSGPSSSPATSKVEGVKVEVTSVSPSKGVLHWKITNTSDVEVYVYDVFLWGSAFGISTKPDRLVFETCPTKIENGYPYHVPPVLLLLIPSHADREGDFKDPQIRRTRGKKISLEIGVGPEPYNVVQDALNVQKLGEADTSPYNVILKWSTIIESKPIQVPKE
jgi:hypothetical protein